MTTENPNEAPDGVEDPRLTSLDARLDAAQRAEAKRTHAPDAPFIGGKGLAQGNRVVSVMLGYPFGGGVIGWFLDSLFHTRPWIMLVLLFLGFAAGCREIMRISKEPPQ